MMAEDDLSNALAPLREKIDDLDGQIIKLLNERAKVVVEIGHIKRNGDSPIYAPDREQRVLHKVRQRNEGPLPDACLEAIWREMMSGSFHLERPLRIGYLGPPGSFSHLAARRKFGASVEYDDIEDIAGVFDQVARKHADLGLVPIENSAIGGIGETLDAFLDTSIHVVAEVLIGIHHNLLSNCPVDQIRKVYSKPEALAQCRRWLGVQLQHAERVAAPSSSKAAEMAANEEGAAAIGSDLAASIYGLKIQFANVEDNPSNITRFFVIGHHPPPPSDDDRTAIMFTTAHKVGALASVLDVFGDHQLNLTHIDKRPSQRVNWEYYFFVDFTGHQSDPKVQQAIDDARAHCLHLAVLGSFPRARDVL